jgi:hypothetical protein
MSDKSLHFGRFSWTPKRVQVVLDLAEGFTNLEVAERNKVSRQTIWKWQKIQEFEAEVDHLTLMIGIAKKAERLQIVKRVVRQMMREVMKIDRDLLDWLKYAQTETDGLRLNLVGLLESLRAGSQGV